MATLTIFIFILFSSVSADPTSSFLFKGFDKDSSFESNLALFGDAKVVNGTFSSVQLTFSHRFSSGRVMYKKPIKLVEGSPRKLVSFSTYFSFSMSSENGSGLAFVMVPTGYPFELFDNSSFGLEFGSKKSNSSAFAVEFDTHMDDKYGDLNGNHVGIDIGRPVSVKEANVSSIDLVLNSGKIVHCWIDYEASSKRLEIRLSKFGHKWPTDPLLTYPIVFPHIWKEEDEFFVGLTSSNGNSNQTCNVHSWSFKLRHVLPWMHSQPLDPGAFVVHGEPLRVPKRSACVLRVLAALIFGTGCGALGALVVLFVWAIFGNKRRPAVQEKLATVHPVEHYYKNIDVVLDKAAVKDGEK